MLLRHGRTAHNAGGVMQGQLDVALDGTGHAEAAAAAAALAALSPAVLLTSDLARARDTAAPLAAAYGIQARPDARLRELSLGTWEGLTGEQAQAAHPEEHAAWRRGEDVRRGGGATYREAGDRAVACLQERLPAVPPDGTLLAVTHGGTARAALGVLLDLPDARWGRLAPLGNACWSVLVEAPWGWRLERHGTTAGPLVGPASLDSFEARGKPL